MPDPRWRQIAEDLRQKIESGDLGRDGKALPSELELRDEYQVSRNTIRDAVKWLVTRGILVTRPGQGTFVVQKIDPLITPLSTEIGAGLGGESVAYSSEVQARSRKPTSCVPKIEVQRAAGMIADELRLTEGATVVSRHQERLIDGIPWSLQTSFYPMHFFTYRPDGVKGSPFARRTGARRTSSGCQTTGESRSSRPSGRDMTKLSRQSC